MYFPLPFILNIVVFAFGIAARNFAFICEYFYYFFISSDFDVTEKIQEVIITFLESEKL